MLDLEALNLVALTLGVLIRVSQLHTLAARRHTWARHLTEIPADTKLCCQ